MNGVKNNKNQSNTIRTNIKKEEPYGNDIGRKQPPRPINEISVREGVPSWKMPMCSRHRVSWKFVCVRGLDRVSWKIVGVRGLDKLPGK